MEMIAFTRFELNVLLYMRKMQHHQLNNVFSVLFLNKEGNKVALN